MDAGKLEKVMKGLEACSDGMICGKHCPYEDVRDSDGPEDNCVAALARDALEIIKEQEARKAEARAMLNALGQAAENMPEDIPGTMPAHIVPRELLMHTWGHGWEERHYRGDDEDPEGFDLIECVWLTGHILTEDGCTAEADSDYWAEHYGKRYGVRLWAGDVEPTQEQREAVMWTD